MEMTDATSPVLIVLLRRVSCSIHPSINGRVEYHRPISKTNEKSGKIILVLESEKPEDNLLSCSPSMVVRFKSRYSESQRRVCVFKRPSGQT